ncbi:hypothetical protein BDW66DRAFT_157442 [Aspergillus desertorum]
MLPYHFVARGWSLTRGGRRWTATGAVVHRGHAGRRRRSTQARRSRRSAHTRCRRRVRGIAISISSLSRWRGKRLLPGSGCSSSRRSAISAGSVTIIVATTALSSPWCCTAIVARPIIVTAVVAATPLLPGGHVACRGSALPGLMIVVVVTVRTGLDPSDWLAIRTGSTARQFLHELLGDVKMNSNKGVTAANGPTAGVETSTVAPIAASLAVWTVASHVPSIATDATDNIGSKVTLFRTVVLAVTDLTA